MTPPLQNSRSLSGTKEWMGVAQRRESEARWHGEKDPNTRMVRKSYFEGRRKPTMSDDVVVSFPCQVNF